MKYAVDIPDDLLGRAHRAGCRDVGQYLVSLMRADLDRITPEVEALLLQRFGRADAGEIADTDSDANGRA